MLLDKDQNQELGIYAYKTIHKQEATDICNPVGGGHLSQIWQSISMLLSHFMHCYASEIVRWWSRLRQEAR